MDGETEKHHGNSAMIRSNEYHTSYWWTGVLL